MTNRQPRPACATAGVDMYPAPSDDLGTARAVAVCDTCQIRQACADGALARREQWGVWGGLTETRRRSMFRHNRVPAHIVRAPSPAMIRREEVARLAGKRVPTEAIAARLGVTVDLVCRDLQRLRSDRQAEKQQEPAGTVAA
ncbi:WhiB family transcriptional regulator [Dactylosporangium roseum]|uniref:Transcriptional regulator WhiB n=1 Tax=Dactylosporangium roseum TaxID=47989 RepID=A0ABY5ZA88_9ACTN|nr:WhiB family transcriptional regulator [Dactylosporangium roseum]UWZ37905.1 WhiB family transcriptional regulator [Dactylosporangium roseum]